MMMENEIQNKIFQDFYLDVDQMRNIIRMMLLGHPFKTSVAWVSFVGLAPSMG
jgi:hypothetical protein